MSENKVVLKSTIAARESSDIKKITRKAVAGISEAELIERNTIGELEQEDNV